MPPQSDKPASNPRSRNTTTSSKAKKLGPRAKGELPDGKFIGSETTQASRARRRPRISFMSLQVRDEDDELPDYSASFGPNSHSNFTWGMSKNEPIPAIKRKKRAPNFNLASILGRRHSSYMEVETTPKPEEPNGPGRSPFFRIPLEIREQLYSYLLLYSKPIILDHLWSEVKKNPPKNLGIMRVCKQISNECSALLYRTNTFLSVLQKSTKAPWEDEYHISPRFTPLFKTLILQFPRENWHRKWYEEATNSIQKLVDADVLLNSLTIVVTPCLGTMSTTAIGLKPEFVTFADLFYMGGEFMAVLQKLKCRVLNIVIKKPEKRQRILIEVDTSQVWTREHEEKRGAGWKTWFESDYLAEMSRDQRKIGIQTQLASLKQRFESILACDGDPVLEVGNCRLLRDGPVSEALARSNIRSCGL
ncbi:hypothetical protein B7494_g7635 [Chlorociboria aeruginascens]|nr:hypothetical protein B7494_g7635 [Chlorociboria aeruginascens]